MSLPKPSNMTEVTYHFIKREDGYCLRREGSKKALVILPKRFKVVVHNKNAQVISTILLDLKNYL